jgi:hypothetical protein
VIFTASGDICYYQDEMSQLIKKESAEAKTNRRHFTGYMISTIMGKSYRDLLLQPTPQVCSE